jgi:hypothetical protein
VHDALTLFVDCAEHNTNDNVLKVKSFLLNAL